MDALRFSGEQRFALRPEQLWRFVADTDGLNRAIGLPAATFTYAGRSDGGSTTTGSYYQGPLLLARWLEHPFEFLRPRHYEVLREYTGGPASLLFISIRSMLDLIPDGDGTLVRVCGEIVPRNAIGMMLASHVVGPRFSGRVLAQCRQYVARLGNAGTARYPFHPPTGHVDERRTRVLARRLVDDGAPPVIAERLAEHLCRSADDQVTDMRPYELADSWGEERDATLVTFLQATTVGLLEMRWVVLCPNCRVPKATYTTLSELRVEASCETCNMVFAANLDRLVEVRFAPASAIREVTRAVFCTGGPEATPHLVAQAELAPGEIATWQLSARPGALRVRSPQSAASAILGVAMDSPGGQTSAESDLQAGSASTVSSVTYGVQRESTEPEEAEVVPGPLEINVRNDTGVLAVVALEECAWPENAATASMVGSLQEFRDLFSSEILASGVQVAIESLALIFTDLAGSTALYERIGQARAFRLVHEHFAVLDQVIRANRGATVKTIGDAVMAVFPTPAHATRAAIGMQCAMRTYRGEEESDPALLLKIGMNAGPCVVVTLNNRLDYFGTAVNLAARMAHLARGGQIVLPAALRTDPAVATVLGSESVRVESYEESVRGMDRPFELARIEIIDLSDATTLAAGESQADDASASVTA